jgi:nucleotide-binding universal stress UspA family protein
MLSARRPAPIVPPLPFARILCAIDGSPGSGEAAHQARVLAGTHARLTFLTVGEHAVHVGGAERHIISHDPDPGRAILKAARGHDLLVLGAHGEHRLSGYRLGSTAVAALRGAPVPVLAARRPPPGAPFLSHILLASDGSPAMGPAVALAAALAHHHSAAVTLVHVGDDDRALRHELGGQASAVWAATGVEPVTLRLAGHRATRIAELARELPASLIIAGSRRLTGFPALASVSAHVSASAPCSLLVAQERQS